MKVAADLMIDHFLKYLEFEKRSSSHTLKAYADDLHSFQEFLVQTFTITTFSETRHAHLRSWVVHLVEAGLSPVSVNRKIATLKSFYKFLSSRAYVTKNPATRLKSLKTEKKLPKFVRESEIVQLLDQVEYPDGFSGLRDRVIIELLYGTGIRLAELIGLKSANVDHFDRSIKVLGKRKKERIIPISTSLAASIKTYNQSKKKEMGETESLLVTDKGEALYPMFVYRLIRRSLAQVTTLSKRSPHVLRHTFATHLLNKGADLNAVKDLLGHTSLAATQVYTHNSMEKLKSAFDQAHPKA